MSKGPAILKVSGVVMIFQSIIGFFIVVFITLSLITMLGKRLEMRSQLFNLSGIFSFLLLGLVLITSVALIICAMKSLNTYKYYMVPGGNNKYLVPNRIVLVVGALTFLMGLSGMIISGSNKGSAILVMLSSAGWILALLNLIIVKKDREERKQEEAAARRF